MKPVEGVSRGLFDTSMLIKMGDDPIHEHDFMLTLGSESLLSEIERASGIEANTFVRHRLRTSRHRVNSTHTIPLGLRLPNPFPGLHIAAALFICTEGGASITWRRSSGCKPSSCDMGIGDSFFIYPFHDVHWGLSAKAYGRIFTCMYHTLTRIAPSGLKALYFEV